MKVKICPTCGERWWCVKCGYCHWCHPDFEPPAGVAVMPQGGSPTLPSLAVNLLSHRLQNSSSSEFGGKSYEIPQVWRQSPGIWGLSSVTSADSHR